MALVEQLYKCMTFIQQLVQRRQEEGGEREGGRREGDGGRREGGWREEIGRLRNQQQSSAGGGVQICSAGHRW